MLTIGNCVSSYIVSRDHPNPEKLRARLDEIARRELPAALGKFFGEGGQRAEGMWFIRNLDVAIDINADWNDEQIALCWAQGIARSFEKARAEGGADAVFFPDRAAHLSSYLISLSAGHTGRQWFFQSFSGLSALPESAAVRTAIEEEPGTGWTALTRMKTDELEKVLEALSPADARRILAVFAGRSTGTQEEPSIYMEQAPLLSLREFSAAANRSALVLVWKTWSAPQRPLAEQAEALFHYLAATRHQADGGEMASAQAAVALTRLVRRLRRDGPGANSLLAALAGGDIATLYVVAGADDAEALRPLLDAAPEWIWEVGRTPSVQPNAPTPAEKAASGAMIRYTPFGGIFFLLPILDTLPLSGAVGDWPVPGGPPAESAIRFTILLICQGRDRFETAFGDPLLRDLFQIPPAWSIRDFTKWRRSIPARRTAKLLRAILAWQMETGLTDGRRLILEPLSPSGAAVLLDPSSGTWIWLGEGRRRGMTALRSLLPADAELFCRDGNFRRTAREAIPERKIRRMKESPGEDGELSLWLARQTDDEGYLRSPPEFPVPCGIDRALTVAAQNVLRIFAHRLPGFSRSGMAHLHRNFLDFTAAIEDLPDRRIVRLGKPPLHLILTMSGQCRQSFRIRGQDDRPFELYPQE